MGYDISFVKNVELTSEQLANDIVRIANIIIDAVNLHAVEIYNNNKPITEGFDEKYITDMVEQLSKIDADNLEIIHADILKTDISQFGENIKIVANIPYYITSPILTKKIK